MEQVEERCTLDGNVLITEVSTANDNGIRDFEGDRSDWIEIHNAGDSTVDLENWYLTDDRSRLTKWRFPALSMRPGDFHIVYASGKNVTEPAQEFHTNFRLSAEGEFLALVRPDGQTIDFEYDVPPLINDYSFGMRQDILETTLLVSGSSVAVHIPLDSSHDTDWFDLNFDDSDWTQGATGVGFGRTEGFPELVATDIRLEMLRRRNASAYLRIPFQVDDASKLTSLFLRIKYDDGFVAFLNGEVVARRNAPADVSWNSEATQSNDNDDAIKFEQIEIDDFSSLQSGDNVLAIHGLNLSRSDSDFLILPELVAHEPGDVDPTSRSFFPLPSPGHPNGIGQSVYVRGVSHSPLEPNMHEDLFVTASIYSMMDTRASLSLRYRVMFDEEVQMPMFDDGRHRDGEADDGVFGALIPGGVAAEGQMIRYYITAEHADGGRSRWPNFFDPLDSEQYFGTVVHDSDTDSSALPIAHLFMEDSSAADTRDGTSGVIFFKGEMYDNVRIDLHGRGSTSFPKKSHDIDFNRDHRFRVTDDVRRVKSINLITNYSDRSMMRTTLVHEAFAAAGAGGHLAFPVRTQLNGEFYAVYDLVEDPGDRFLERIDRAPDGALYKMLDPLQSTANGIPETRTAEDKTALQRLIDAAQLPPGSDRAQFLFDNINLPEMASFLAMLSITVHSDCCFTNYYLYRDTNGTGEWEAFPFDVDNSMGNWVHQDNLRTREPIYSGRGTNLFGLLYDDPQFEQMYLRRLRTLKDEFYGAPGSKGRFERRIDELEEALNNDAQLDNEKWPPWGATTWSRQVSVLRHGFLAARRDFLDSQTVRAGGPIPDAQPDDVELRFGAIDVSPPTGDQDEEYIELINPNGFAVDISDWSLAGAVKMTFKRGTVIPADSSLFLSPNVNAFRSRSEAPTGGQGLFVQGAYEGRLPSQGGTLTVLDYRGRVAATTDFHGEPTPAEQFLRLTELMFNPTDMPSNGFNDASDFEFIELRNTSDNESIDLSNVTLSEAVQFDFAQSDVQELGPLQFTVVVNDIVAFEARYGKGLPVAGEFDGNLSNNSEQIVLSEAGTRLVDFTYQDEWHPITDGGGPSLVIVNERDDVSQWNNKSAWRSSRWNVGSPGSLDDRLIGDVNSDGQFDSSDLVQVLLAGEYEDDQQNNSTFEDGDWNGDGDFDSTDLILAFESHVFKRLAVPVDLKIAAVDGVFGYDERRGSSEPFSGFLTCNQPTDFTL